MSLLAAANPLEHIIQHPLKTIEIPWGSGVIHLTVLSDQIVIMVLAGVLLALLPIMIKRRRGDDEVGRLVAGGFANFIEVICAYLRKEVAQPVLLEHTDRFIKYVWSVFFFILTMNLLGLTPIGVVAPLFGLHIGGTPTANIWVTGTMAVLTLFMMVINGLRLGGKAYLAHFCPGPIALAPLLVPVEVIGLFAKVFALAVRLFANMMAGHTLLAVLLSFILMAGTSMGAMGGIAIAIPVVLASAAIFMLEIFVAFLQAFIFTFLTTLFIGMSVNVHHEDDHEEAHAH